MNHMINFNLLRIGKIQPAIALLLTWSLFNVTAVASDSDRDRSSFDADWRFTMGDPANVGDELSYTNIKQWVMANGNQFIKDGQSTTRPSGNLGDAVTYTQTGFDDSGWQHVSLPHDWAIAGPFKQEYSGSTGKLKFWGVGWYRKHFNVAASDQGRRIVLAVDGAMSYANVWVNGQYVGGWPYGYASWQLDLTPCIKYGGENVVAIRLDNPPDSSRWYPGGGIYRHVWLIKTGPIHVGQWGTYVTTPDIKSSEATVKIQVTVDNSADSNADVSVENEIYELKQNGAKVGPVAFAGAYQVEVAAHSNQISQS